jgi:hypothetical protein
MERRYNMATINLTEGTEIIEEPHVVKLNQVRNDIQLLYSNKDFEEYETLLCRVLKNVDEVLKEI